MERITLDIPVWAIISYLGVVLVVGGLAGVAFYSGRRRGK